MRRETIVRRVPGADRSDFPAVKMPEGYDLNKGPELDGVILAYLENLPVGVSPVDEVIGESGANDGNF